jgi:hypothetical protein
MIETDRAGSQIIAFAGLVLLASACFHRAPRRVPPPLQPPVQQVEPPSAMTQTAPLLGATTFVEPAEPYIDLTAENGDVRLILQRIAEAGKIDLIIPSTIHKTISVRYVHVPASAALKDVLHRSGLRLGAGTSGPLPFDTVTVFYRLPVNIDSLSVDAIMRRFGVSREMAELLATSRPPEKS